MSRSACLFLHKHNIIVKWENIHNVIDQFYTELAVALYYKSSGIEDDMILLEDIGLTICCDANPAKLMHYLREKQYQITSPFTGIYYIYKDGHIDTQIVITCSVTEVEPIGRNFFFPIAGASRVHLTM